LLGGARSGSSPHVVRARGFEYLRGLRFITFSAKWITYKLLTGKLLIQLSGKRIQFSSESMMKLACDNENGMRIRKRAHPRGMRAREKMGAG
jgi:hypothetical protein